MTDPTLSKPAAALGAPRWLPPLIGATIIVSVFIAFLPALFAEFLQWDDQVVLLSNDRYHAFTVDNLIWMTQATINGHWMPLTWLSYAIDYALWGADARGYHLTNLIIHAINGILVYALALRLIAIARGLSGKLPTRIHIAAAFAALFFAVHPLRTESVAWVTERRDVLSAMFLLAAALAYLRSAAPGRVPIRSMPWYIASIALLALSLLGKAWGMSFFIVVMAIDWYPLRRLPFSPFKWLTGDGLTVLIQKIPFAALGIFALMKAAHAVEAVFSPKTLDEWSITSRIVQAFYGLFWYIRTSLWPTNLSPLYELPVPLNPWEPRFIAAYVFALFATIFLWVSRHRLPALVAAMGVYCVTIAPVLGFNQSGEQFVADRYSYLSCIGLVIVAAAGLLKLHESLSLKSAPPSRGHLLLPIAGAILTAALTLLTFSQTTHWRTTLTLWEYAMTVTPTPTLRTNYASALMEAGRKEEAIKEFERVVAERPTQNRAWFILANEYRDRGSYSQAEHAYKQVIAQSPLGYTAKVNLGLMYLKHLNRPQDAIDQLRDAVRDIESGGRRELSARPYMALGDALRRTGDTAGARAAFTKAMEFEETRSMAEMELKNLGK